MISPLVIIWIDFQDRWVNPESTQGSTPNPVYTTSLLQALRDDVDAGSYNSPYYYTNGFDHTVVMPVADEAHWFVIRTTKGDHPSKSLRTLSEYVEITH
jgi:hypothetical protein